MPTCLSYVQTTESVPWDMFEHLAIIEHLKVVVSTSVGSMGKAAGCDEVNLYQHDPNLGVVWHRLAGYRQKDTSGQMVSP